MLRRAHYNGVFQNTSFSLLSARNTRGFFFNNYSNNTISLYHCCNSIPGRNPVNYLEVNLSIFWKSSYDWVLLEFLTLRFVLQHLWIAVQVSYPGTDSSGGFHLRISVPGNHDALYSSVCLSSLRSNGSMVFHLSSPLLQIQGELFFNLFSFFAVVKMEG